MKKLLFYSLAILFFLTVFLFPEPTNCQVMGDIKTQLDAAGGASGAGYAAPQDPRLTVARMIRVALEFLGIIFIVLTMYAGFSWMTAGGNEEKVTKAKTLLTQATIGLVIILSAYSITLMVIKIISGRYTDYTNGYFQEGIPPPIECTGLSCP